MIKTNPPDGGAEFILEDYDFKKPWEVWQTRDEFLNRLISTRAFLRLRSVRFLGAIDYLLIRSPNGARGNIRHTRYEHSLGVARLALLYAGVCGLQERERRLFAAAALLHDLGHPPLSHSLEPLFENMFGIEHHQATCRIITGQVPLGKTLYAALRQYRVDIDELLSLISGTTRFPGHEFFSGPINFDTVEGILRSNSYANWQSTAPSPDQVIASAFARRTDVDRAIVDSFWKYKGKMYGELINSPVGTLADMTASLMTEAAAAHLTESDYFLGEPQLFRKVPGLREALTSKSFLEGVWERLPDTVTHTVRIFSVNEEADFFARQDRDRYKQSKRVSSFSISRLRDEVDAKGLKRHVGDLFDRDRAS